MRRFRKAALRAAATTTLLWAHSVRPYIHFSCLAPKKRSAGQLSVNPHLFLKGLQFLLKLFPIESPFCIALMHLENRCFGQNRFG